MRNKIQLFQADVSTKLALPLLVDRLSCGFPSPASDFIDQKLDLNEHLIRHVSATFFARAIGDSMIEANLRSGDIAIVDRSLEARHGSVVLAVLNGEFVTKRLSLDGKRIILVPENPKYRPHIVRPEEEFGVWGVITNTIHRHL